MHSPFLKAPITFFLAIGEQYQPPTVILFYDGYFYAHVRGQELHLIRLEKRFQAG